MSLRRKLLALSALTVFLSVAAVTWIVSSLTRQAFDRADEDRRASLVAQFRREFDRRGQEVANRVQTIASGDTALQIATAINRGSPDYASHLNEARILAENQQLDFLEFVEKDGTIISSAQSPAAFGYKETLFSDVPLPATAFLHKESSREGPALALSAARTVTVGDKPLYVVGGKRLDKEFLASLELPAGMRAMLYADFGAEFSPANLISASLSASHPEQLSGLIAKVAQTNRDASEIVHWSSNPAEDELVQAIPLDGLDGRLLGMLIVGNSREPYVELRKHIRSTGLLVGGTGIVLAILFSGWIAARVTRPVEQLAKAASDVAAGNWDIQVPVASRDELGLLAESFNRMTRELLEQKDRALQAERVAAWRELARRLAHELKNPLFPLQLTVENLIRARDQSAELFDEIFRESATTLLAEIANLKVIISRFSDFSKMPQPQLRAINVNDVVRDVARLFQAQLSAPNRNPIACVLNLDSDPLTIGCDPELLHRALSNLVLNAMDAMASGGTLTINTRPHEQDATIEVSDTGSGLTPEECSRLFTPYYTSKTHGTGLGLAIVQSAISDHGGRISVHSVVGRGTTFSIELPGNMEKLGLAQSSSNATS
ncbi:MAG TPA: ATP-binding protein [Terriglobales bacterium]|nr:ATP-binding protein [Terriglobales bacterium]